jgi:hypothetical protein
MPSCICLGSAARPNCPEPPPGVAPRILVAVAPSPVSYTTFCGVHVISTLPSAERKFVRLKTFNISARSCRATFLPSLMFLQRAASTRKKPGPSQTWRPEVPFVPIT